MVEQHHLIDLRNVSKEFDGVQVLKDINLHPQEGIRYPAWPLRLRQDHHAAHHRRL